MGCPGELICNDFAEPPPWTRSHNRATTAPHLEQFVIDLRAGTQWDRRQLLVGLLVVAVVVTVVVIDILCYMAATMQQHIYPDTRW